MARHSAPALLLALATASAGCGGASPAPDSTLPPPATAKAAPAEAEPRRSAVPDTPPASAPSMSAPSMSAPPTSAPPAAPAPSPIPGDLPADVDGSLAARAACAARCSEAGFYPPGAVVDARSPAATWSYALERKGAEAAFPRHVGVDLYGVCVRGEVTLSAAEKPGEKKKLAPWTAFRAPGAGVALAAAGDGARVVLALVGGGEPIGDAVALLKAKGAKTGWTARPAPIELSDLASARDLAWAGGAMHARIGFEGEKQRASLGLLMLSQDAPVAQHTHDGSWEILAALRAEGTLRRADAAGVAELTAIQVVDGTVSMVPKGALHAWEPGRRKPLVAIQLYVPPGPEQRFKKLAEAAPQKP